MRWSDRLYNLACGQSYLKFLSLASLLLFLAIGFILWHRAGESSVYSLQNHLLQKREELDFKLSVLTDSVNAWITLTN